MLKKLLLSVLVVYPYSYCYSDSIVPYYGTTGNAAASGHSWSMENVLPIPPGLDINAVIYDYVIQKEVEDSVDVHVQNENANGTGYIFRETDSWKPGSLGGTEIRKVVPVIPNIPRSAWGQGSIEVEGNGTVEDASVVYSYKVDPCYNPQVDPNCPGYKVILPEIPQINLDDIYDATEDEYVNLNDEERSLIDENEETLEDKDEEEEEKEEELKRKYRLEKLMSAGDIAALISENIRIQSMNAAIDQAVNSNEYLKSIPGGEYKENVVLKDGKLEDNKKGLRNGLAQQLLHEKMVDMQYNN